VSMHSTHVGSRLDELLLELRDFPKIITSTHGVS
jgi:hypothetical protein